MGILWNNLCKKSEEGTLKSNDKKLLKKLDYLHCKK